jgi:predicted nucleotidyltransferase
MASQPETSTGLTADAKSRIASVFAEYPAIDEVLLYGSRAKGTYRPGSDIDLTIRGQLSYEQLQKIEQQLDDLLLPYKIDLSLYHHIDNPNLVDHIRRVGQIFYSRGT